MSKMQSLEKEKGLPIVEILNNLYEKHGNQTAVAIELGISQSTLSLWLMKLGLAEKKILVKRENGK